MGSIIVYTLWRAFTKVATFCGVLAVRGRPVDFRFNTDPVALKLVTHTINVSTMKARCSLVQFMAAKETKNNCVIKKQSKMALYEKKGITHLHMNFLENKNTLSFLYFICLLFNLQMCQFILLTLYLCTFLFLYIFFFFLLP